MKRSDEDIDRLLREWDRVASTSRPPTVPAPRRQVRTTAALPASLLVLALAAVTAVGIVGRGAPGPAASPGAGDVAAEVVSGPVSGSVTAGGFRLVLTAARAAYVAGDVIDASATVEFLGPESRREVQHASVAVVFSVREVDGPRHVDGGTRLAAVTTSFERGVPVSYAWVKSGSPDQPDGIEGYFDGETLRLPAGTWRLEATFADGITAGVTVTVVAGPTAEATPAEATPAETAAPAGPEVSPPVRCGRIDPPDCEDAIGLVAPLEPEAMRTSRAIVVDDTCSPAVACRRVPERRFDAVVAFLLPEEGGWRAYRVSGTAGPETVERWQAPPPEGIATLIEEGPDLGTGRVLEGVPTLAPRNTMGPVECPASLVTGTLVTHPRWGLAVAAGGVARKVTWPFGWAVLRSDADAWLVDGTGTAVARLGDELEVGGGEVACGGVRVAAVRSGPLRTPGTGGLVATGVAMAGPFELTLAVDRTTYAAGEDILPVATVVARGSDPLVTVGHGSSPVAFSVREVAGDGREAVGGVDTICLTSTWSRGEPQVFPWRRGGSWSSDHPTANDRFVQAYAGRGPRDGLWLPGGTWELSVTLDVNIGGCGPSSPLTATVRIHVVEAPETSPTPGPDATLGPVVRCVRVAVHECEGAVARARDRLPVAYAAADLVLVVDTCPTDADCDRQSPFEVHVALLPDAGVAAGTTVLVHGRDGPDVVDDPVTGGLPTDELDGLAEQGLGDGSGGTLFPVRVTSPSDARDDASCPAGIVSGTLDEVEPTGLGFRDGDRVVAVSWPFGWSGRRADGTVTLVDAYGGRRGTVGRVFRGSGAHSAAGTAVICE